MTSSDITFVITGHLHPNSLQVLPIYASLGNVIISCYNVDDFNNLNTYRLPSDASVIVLPNPVAPVTSCETYAKDMILHHPFTDPTFFKHVYLQQAALPFVKTKFTIFLKSEEYYTVWDEFIETLKCNPYKMTVTSVSCQKCINYPYHLSKHIIAGRTDMLRKSVDAFWSITKNNMVQEIERLTSIMSFPSEKSFVDSIQLYCILYLEKNDIPLPTHPTQRLYNMKQWFSVVSVRKMGSYAYNLSNIYTPTYITQSTLENKDYIGALETLNYSIDHVAFGTLGEKDDIFKNAVLADRYYQAGDYFQCVEFMEKAKGIECEEYKNRMEDAISNIT